MHDVPTVGHPIVSAKVILNEVKQRLNAERLVGPSLATSVIDGLPLDNEAHMLEEHTADSVQPNRVAQLSSKECAQARKIRKKAKAVHIQKKPHPTIRNIDLRLSQILPLQLYSFLLSKLFNDDPVRLRAFLTAEDPGPGFWDTRHCLHLLDKGWEGVSMMCPPELSLRIREAIWWLQGFWDLYAQASRAHLRPGLTAASRMDSDEMQIDDSTYQQPDDATLQQDWNHAGQALSLVFGGWMEDSAGRELGGVVDWMMNGTAGS